MTKARAAVAIIPEDSGFGEWQQALGTYRKVGSVRQAALFYSDGAVDRAIPVENLDREHNISGLIHNEPDEVYAIPDGYGSYTYFGVWRD